MSESDYESTILTHYGNGEVQQEIAKFSQNRWVAIHCEILNQQRLPVLLRYQRGGGKNRLPLTIGKPEDVPHLLNQFRRLRPRTFYASVSVYKELNLQESVRASDNIVSSTPTWDIDNTLDKWKATIEAAREIVTFLRAEGVVRSVFIKWSGQGAHVHVHHRAFSAALLQKIAPLDAAFAMVEHVNRKLKSRYAKVAQAYQANEFSVENEVDLQRVFTCPLSLHRSLTKVAVCIAPDSIDEFTPDWAMVGGFRHWKGWDSFEAGEADALALKAYRSVGGYKVKTRAEPRPREKTASIAKWLGN